MATEKEKSDNYLKAKNELRDLFEAVQSAPLAQVQQKIKQIVDGSQDQEEKLTFASVVEDYKEGSGKTLLHFAAARGDLEIFKYLSSENADIDFQDESGNTPLFVAAQHDHLPLVKYMIEEKKCSVKQARQGGTTILHIACSTGNIGLVEYLINKGADLEASSEIGTPLQWAISSVKTDIVKLLLNKGASPNKIAVDQKLIPPPLILAIDARNAELVDYLLEKGADPNSKDSEGWNALQFAAEVGDLRLCNILISKNIDPNYEVKGQTAIELALMNGHMEVFSLLKPLTTKSVEGKPIQKPAVQTEAVEEKSLPFDAEQVEKLKTEGNKLFAEKKLQESVDKYDEALQYCKGQTVAAPIHSNKALCLLQLGEKQEALEAAQSAKAADPSWRKAYLREAQIYEAMEEFGEAAATYFEVLKLDPSDSDLKHSFDKNLEKAKEQYRKSKK